MFLLRHFQKIGVDIPAPFEDVFNDIRSNIINIKG